MDRLNDILKQAKKQSETGSNAAKETIKKVESSEFYSQKIKRFMTQNRVPRYIIYALIAVKITTIYDKIKQLVAINNIYAQIIREQRDNFKDVFKHSENNDGDAFKATNEDLMQDLLTRKILQINNLDDESLISVDKPDLTGRRV